MAAEDLKPDLCLARSMDQAHVARLKGPQAAACLPTLCLASLAPLDSFTDHAWLLPHVQGSKAAEWPPTKSDRNTVPLTRLSGVPEGAAHMDVHRHPAGDLHSAPQTPRSPGGHSPPDHPRRMLRNHSKRRSSFHLFRHSSKPASESSGTHHSDNEDFNVSPALQQAHLREPPLPKLCT